MNNETTLQSLVDALELIDELDDIETANYHYGELDPENKLQEILGRMGVPDPTYWSDMFFDRVFETRSWTVRDFFWQRVHDKLTSVLHGTPVCPMSSAPW